MLASWGGSEIKDLLVKYSSKTNISELEVGIRDNGELYFPPFSYIKREIRFTAIEGLKNYPSLDVFEAVCEYAHEEDADIRSIAIKTLKRLEKEVNK